jgi:Na+/H+ antiporter NhaB
MRIFKSVTFTWWQEGLLKITAVSLGIVIGVTWRNLFEHLIIPLIVIFVVAGIYLLSVWLKE